MIFFGVLLCNNDLYCGSYKSLISQPFWPLLHIFFSFFITVWGSWIAKNSCLISLRPIFNLPSDLIADDQTVARPISILEAQRGGSHRQVIMVFILITNPPPHISLSSTGLLFVQAKYVLKYYMLISQSLLYVCEGFLVIQVIWL